eukprot:gb/GECH01007286.1/.p1 GENE.gb/GECH01007286.1/~~gb/GECH01007286.1/.p1  ORF type:complete len:156 (+),score=20.19 gb/GECH01007286.1/:1-468(+)
MSIMPPVAVGVAVFVVKDNQYILIGKRKGSHGSGTWQLPGGHLEYGEEWATCGMREVKEETNLDVEQLDFVTATNDIFTHENKHYVTLFMKTSSFSSQVMVLEPHKCDAWEWVTWDELKNRSPLFLPLHNLIQREQGERENNASNRIEHLLFNTK